VFRNTCLLESINIKKQLRRGNKNPQRFGNVSGLVYSEVMNKEQTIQWIIGYLESRAEMLRFDFEQPALTPQDDQDGFVIEGQLLAYSELIEFLEEELSPEGDEDE